MSLAMQVRRLAMHDHDLKHGLLAPITVTTPFARAHSAPRLG